MRVRRVRRVHVERHATVRPRRDPEGAHRPQGGAPPAVGFNVPGSPGRSPGPTLRVRAGDTLRTLLKNNMPPELVSTTSSTKNGYHDFSVWSTYTRTGASRFPSGAGRRGRGDGRAPKRDAPVRLPYSRRPYGRHALVPSPLARSGLDSRQLRRGLVLGVRVGSYYTVEGHRAHPNPSPN